MEHDFKVEEQFMTDHNEDDLKKRLGKKLMLMADRFASRMFKFADDIEGYCEDAAEAVSPKKKEQKNET